MNSLGAAIQSILSQQGRNLSDLSAASGIGTSTISKLIKGSFAASPEKLKALYDGIGDDPAHKGEIVRSHLLDELSRAGISPELLSISVAGNDEVPLRELVDARLYETLKILGLEASKDQTFRDVLESFEELLTRSKDASQDEWHIDDGEKAAIIKLAARPNLTPKSAYKELKADAAELLYRPPQRL